MASISAYENQINLVPNISTIKNKHYFSIVLLAVTGANGNFVIVDVGACGGNSNGGVLSRSSLWRKMVTNKLFIPKCSVIPDTEIELPFMLVMCTEIV